MKPRVLAIFLALIHLSSRAASTGEKPVTVYFTENKPVACLKIGQPTCFGLWVAVQALTSGAIPFVIREVPWKRAESNIRTDPDAVFVATLRMPSNEDRYGWVAPLYSDRTILMGLKPPSDITERSLVGVRAGSPFTAEAHRNGWTPVEISSWNSAEKMLQSGRLDYVYATRMVIEYNFVQTFTDSKAMTRTYDGEVAWWIIAGRDDHESPSVIALRDAVNEFTKTADYRAKLDAMREGAWFRSCASIETDAGSQCGRSR